MGSAVSPEFVATVASSIAVGVHPEACQALAHDVEYRLREVIQDALKFASRSRRSYLTTEDVNSALRLRNPLYGFMSRDPAKFLRAAGHPDVYYVSDPEVSVAAVASAPLPRPPVEVAVVPHWLAIDGKQPVIPENSPPAAAAAPSAPAGAAAARDPDDATLVRAPLRHVLTREMQAYLDRRAVLASLASDAGLQPLLPYFFKLIADEAVADLRALRTLPRLVSALRALTSNPEVDAGPLLHEALPPLLTALVARRLGARRVGRALGSARARGARWRCSARATAPATSRSCPGCSARWRARWRAARPAARSLAARYGAALGLAALGPRSVRGVLLPHFSQLLREAAGTPDEERVTQALAAAAGGLLLYLATRYGSL
ncbi:hypothetical protein QBZ16_003011 [Prototheca wickerhamii]|uniref:TATA box binding protein associated factor (TAF) histone-like fold domain-containing protein n=1 Tax=Prototheca wickerhamii TaxID=3111 RepID=A0AAD9ML85_PROWI|nr:hypothetical protein QBZ16_003011 [Prototheca wickerhamii]